MRLWLLFVAAFSQAVSQLLSDTGGLYVESFDAALPKSQEVNWPALSLAGLDSPGGYLASQPDSTPQSNPLQPLPHPADSGSLTPESDTDPFTVAGCASPSPQTNPPPPQTKIKRKLLRERQTVQDACPGPMPLTAGSATPTSSQNPRIYPGGTKHRIKDWIFGTPQEWKQCPPEKKTLCCTGVQEGPNVQTCTPCTLLPKAKEFLVLSQLTLSTVYLFPGSSTTSVSCFNGGIYCCDDLVASASLRTLPPPCPFPCLRLFVNCPGQNPNLCN